MVSDDGKTQKYDLNNSKIKGYGRPNYDEETSTSDTPQPTNNGNKYLVRLLFKHAINYLNKEENRNDEVKGQIELALKLLENDEIDCSMINIMNINNEITKSLKILVENLTIIKKKIILKEHLNIFKYNTLNYVKMSECMQKKYVISLNYLKEKLEKKVEDIK